MPLFVVERELPGVTPDMITSAGLRAKSCCTEMREQGSSIRWVRSFFLPEFARTHCYFEGSSREDVEELNRRANIPFTRIVEVMEMTPESL